MLCACLCVCGACAVCTDTLAHLRVDVRILLPRLSLRKHVCMYLSDVHDANMKRVIFCLSPRPHISSLHSLSPCDSRSQSLEFKQTVLRLKMIETNLQGDE
jgi:hypothetical protein